MISSLTGLLHQVDEDRIHLRVGALVFEALVPASDVPLLQAGIGEEMTFHTILYFEGDAGGGSLEPRLLGFLRPEDKQFFQKFVTVKGIGPKKALKALIYPAGDVTVKGIGPKKALKALIYPAGDIARAIEGKDTRFLKGLPMIGNRMAEQIVAELAGKVKEFATATAGGQPSIGPSARSAVEEDALAALMALGERRVDAEALLDRARQVNPNLKTTNDFVREMLRMRTVRA